MMGNIMMTQEDSKEMWAYYTNGAPDKYRNKHNNRFDIFVKKNYNKYKKVITSEPWRVKYRNEFFEMWYDLRKGSMSLCTECNNCGAGDTPGCHCDFHKWTLKITIDDILEHIEKKKIKMWEFYTAKMYTMEEKDINCTILDASHGKEECNFTIKYNDNSNIPPNLFRDMSYLISKCLEVVIKEELKFPDKEYLAIYSRGEENRSKIKCNKDDNNNTFIIQHNIVSYDFSDDHKLIAKNVDKLKGKNFILHREKENVFIVEKEPSEVFNKKFIPLFYDRYSWLMKKQHIHFKNSVNDLWDKYKTNNSISMTGQCNLCGSDDTPNCYCAKHTYLESLTYETVEKNWMKRGGRA